MNYYDVFQSRINHMGTTTAERIRNGGIRSFYKWMAESPHTVTCLSVERGIYFPGIILTNKDKEYQKIMFLNVANNIDLRIGDIMNWPQDNGTTEKWILFQEEKKVNGIYRTFWIVRCNYLLKWIDNNGHLQQSWAYLVSSTDDKIKGNFRTWHNLITPQPNKYAEILMPRYPIERSTNFIVEDESWIVIEYDHTSVPNIIYLSLTENKVNLIYDDLDNDIADLDKLANYQFVTFAEPQVFHVGDIIEPTVTLMKNGVLCTLPIQFITTDRTHVKNENGRLRAYAQGNTQVIVQLVDFPNIQQEIDITIDAADTFSAYIEGPDIIRLDRKATYVLRSDSELDGPITYAINNNLATLNIQNNECILHANANNELGTITLTATYNGINYTKVINIIPIW